MPVLSGGMAWIRRSTSTADDASWRGSFPESIACSIRFPSTASIKTYGRPSTTGSAEVASTFGTGKPSPCSAAMILA